MGKKRKSIGTRIDEVDRTMYATFCSAASSLSQLYTQAMNHQKLSFVSGEKHSLEKLYQWILRQQEAGVRVSTFDILTYLQREIDYCGDETSVSPRAPQAHLTSNGLLVSGPSAQTLASQAPRTEQENQVKNLVFSNALSSPLRNNLQHYHLTQGQQYPNGSTPGGLQNRESNSNDSSMDMHQDSPGPQSNY